jgi:hypothetical protein
MHEQLQSDGTTTNHVKTCGVNITTNSTFAIMNLILVPAASPTGPRTYVTYSTAGFAIYSAVALIIIFYLSADKPCMHCGYRTGKLVAQAVPTACMSRRLQLQQHVRRIAGSMQALTQQTILDQQLNFLSCCVSPEKDLVESYLFDRRVTVWT